jgi:hypothetical protein
MPDALDRRSIGENAANAVSSMRSIKYSPRINVLKDRLRAPQAMHGLDLGAGRLIEVIMS